MKRFSFFIIMLALIFVFGGCAPSSSGLGMDDILPWTSSNRHAEEYCKYNVTRYLGDHEPVGSEPLWITADNSYLEYTLKEGKSLENVEMGEITSMREKNDSSSTLIHMKLMVEYLDEEGVPELYRRSEDAPDIPIVDTIESWTVIDKNTLTAKMTKRITRGVCYADDIFTNSTLLVDYTGEFIGSRKALLQDENKKVRQLKIPSGSYFDNESLFYVVRSLSSIKQNTSKSFSFALPYDNFLSGSKSVTKRGIMQSTQKDLVSLPLPDKITSMYKTTESLDALKTVLTLTAEKSGAPIELYFAAMNIQDPSTGYDGKPSDAASSKLLLKIINRSYKTNGSVAFTQCYDLVDYTNKLTSY